MANKKTSGSSKRSSKKTVRALTPAVRYLRYELTNSAGIGTETSYYVDLARDLSRVNRRLYRQGRDYHVKKITIVSSNTPNLGNRVSVSTCPSTWVSQGAWKRGYSTWKRMNAVATTQTSNDIAGTWADFKVWLSRDMQTGVTVQPKDNGGNYYTAGEWVYSQLVTPDGTTGADEFDLHMLGGHVGGASARTSVGLIKSYGESRATVSGGSPEVPGDASTDPLINVFDYGTTVDDVVENLEFDNDFPPYSLADYPGDDLNAPKPAVVQDTTIVDGRAVLGGFTALCGLLEFEVKSALPSDVYSVLVELSPGSYRGIKAEAI